MPTPSICSGWWRINKANMTGRSIPSRRPFNATQPNRSIFTTRDSSIKNSINCPEAERAYRQALSLKGDYVEGVGEPGQRLAGKRRIG